MCTESTGPVYDICMAYAGTTELALYLCVGCSQTPWTAWSENSCIVLTDSNDIDSDRGQMPGPQLVTSSVTVVVGCHSECV